MLLLSFGIITTQGILESLWLISWSTGRQAKYLGIRNVIEIIQKYIVYI